MNSNLVSAEKKGIKEVANAGPIPQKVALIPGNAAVNTAASSYINRKKPTTLFKPATLHEPKDHPSAQSYHHNKYDKVTISPI